jgi:phage shock protein PspC (stress-responsive transcriptional regulator)
MERLRNFIEWQVFGVCTRIGEVMGLSASTIRKYFIYTSCLTFGSPVLLYIVLAFWMNMKRYLLQSRRNPLRYN